MTLTLLISFAILLVLGCPVAFAIGLSSIITVLFVADIPLIIIPQKMFGGIDKFVLLALPFYITIGVVMEKLELTEKIVEIADSLAGHLKGSLAQIKIVASVIFGGIQGSGNADAAALGSIFIPIMIKKGYTPSYSCAVVASAAQIGPIIPPSLVMIIYGSITGDSVAKLFLAGFLPGFLMAFLLMIVAYFYAVHGGQTSPIEHSFSFINFLRKLKSNLPIVGIPFMIVGGIIMGVFTPTEAGCVTVVYTFVIALIFYRRQLNWGMLKEIFIKASTTTSMVLIIISSASLFNWVLSVDQIPQNLFNYLVRLNLSPTSMVLLIILILLIVGCFMDAFASMVILVPILYPIGQQIGMDPIQFGLVIILALCIGAITPPLGLPLFITISIAKCPAEDAFRACLPFVLALLICVLIVAFVPQLTTVIPRLLS